MQNVKRTQLEYVGALRVEHKRVKDALDRLHPRESEAIVLKYRRRISDLDEQIAAARTEIVRLTEAIKAANDSFCAPTNNLLARILKHARVHPSELGINFADPLPAEFGRLLDPALLAPSEESP